MPDLLDNTIEALNALPVDQRGRVKIHHILSGSHLKKTHLQKRGLLLNAPLHDSYGRDVLSHANGFNLPPEMEILAVTLHPFYAPAIHTHGPGTVGANLLCLGGSFYNVDYVFEKDAQGNELFLKHQRIQKFSPGDVAFVSDNHIHRVVNGFDAPAYSLNVYWDNNSFPGEVGDKAFVYDFVNGTRVTTGGPAFFFIDGEDRQPHMRATALVRMEDIVFQHHQLVNAMKLGELPPERQDFLRKVETAINGDEMNNLWSLAALQAQKLLQQTSPADKEATAEYLNGLFERFARLTGRNNTHDFARAQESYRA